MSDVNFGIKFDLVMKNWNVFLKIEISGQECKV